MGQNAFESVSVYETSVRMFYHKLGGRWSELCPFVLHKGIKVNSKTMLFRRHDRKSYILKD